MRPVVRQLKMEGFLEYISFGLPIPLHCVQAKIVR